MSLTIIAKMHNNKNWAVENSIIETAFSQESKFLGLPVGNSWDSLLTEARKKKIWGWSKDTGLKEEFSPGEYESPSSFIKRFWSHSSPTDSG